MMSSMWRSKVSELSRVTPRTFSISDTATLKPATVTDVGGDDFLSRCDVPKNGTSDLSVVNCRLFRKKPVL